MPRSTRALRDEIDIRDAARRLGLDIDGHGRAHCPICGSRRKNLSIGNGMWHCFACGEAGELVKLAQVCLNTDWRGAAEWLAREYGINLEYEATRPPTKEELRKRREIRERIAFEKWCEKARGDVIWAQVWLRDNPVTWENYKSTPWFFGVLLDLTCLYDEMWRALCEKRVPEEYREFIGWISAIREEVENDGDTTGTRRDMGDRDIGRILSENRGQFSRLRDPDRPRIHGSVGRNARWKHET